jgi:hypothetical protein
MPVKEQLPPSVRIAGKDYPFALKLGHVRRLCQRFGSIMPMGQQPGWSVYNVDFLCEVLAQVINDQRRTRVTGEWIADNLDTDLPAVQDMVQTEINRTLGLKIVDPDDEDEDEGKVGEEPEGTPDPEAPRASSTQRSGSRQRAK